MIIIFDKTQDSNISAILSISNNGDILDSAMYWFNSETSNSWIIDTTGFKIRICADDTNVCFKNYDSMTPYLEQYAILFPQRSVPSIKKIVDPYNDLPKTGQTISHNYNNTFTDIEKDLLKK